MKICFLEGYEETKVLYNYAMISYDYDECNIDAMAIYGMKKIWLDWILWPCDYRYYSGNIWYDGEDLKIARVKVCIDVEAMAHENGWITFGTDSHFIW